MKDSKQFLNIFDEQMQRRLNDYSKGENVPIPDLVVGFSAILAASYTSHETIVVDCAGAGFGEKGFHSYTFQRKNLLGQSLKILCKDITVQNSRPSGIAAELDESCKVLMSVGEDQRTTSLSEQGYSWSLQFHQHNPSYLEIVLNQLVFPIPIEKDMLAHYWSIVNRILDSKAETVMELVELSTEQRQQIIEDFQSSRDWGEDIQKTYSELFEQQAKRTPDSIALIYDEEQLTYQEVNEKANQLARYFIENGLHPAAFVAVYMERSPLLVICMLAIWKAGAVYIPLDPEYPATRTEMIIEDCIPVLLIASGQVDLKVPSAVKTINLKAALEESEIYSKLNILLNVSADDLSYIIYTSGSTGRPKGVMIEHKGMNNHLFGKIADLHINSSSIIAQNASHCFDISIWQLLAALLLGGKTVIYSNRLIKQIHQFIARIAADKVQILEVVPSYLSVMLDWLARRPADFPNLKFVMVTGEALSLNLVKRWKEHYPAIDMVNAYGPTEASDDITHCFMSSQISPDVVPIGKPLYNMKVLVLDNTNHLCKIGVKGEIVVAGIGVGRGYYSQEDKTNAAFVHFNHLNAEHTEERFYRTGDIGCWTTEGDLLYFGRVDHQVKVRGFRIELSDIDIAVCRYAGVKEAITVVRTDERGNKQLEAFVTVTAELNKELLLEYLGGQLPGYMIPAQITTLEQFPLTVNGKIDRAQLINFTSEVGEQLV
ncbi:amino acid adenylation domain-containing protein [Paenibacillus sp. KS-LC4]|uniref:amino acid adenylation domain-containing protein n=1 Tax=Paenibacillus sp. KS-LC4 TaxID=2979727 RepID=UPI0030CE536A